MSRALAVYAHLLRQELCLRNHALSAAQQLPHVLSYGEMPVIVYRPSDDNRQHGNFLPATYAAITCHPDWSRRLEKHHSQARRALPQGDYRWRELDSSTSSDALLMNVFCYPGVVETGMLASLLGVHSAEVPVFGFKARVPLRNGRTDRTEVDMQLGNLLVESKLTEGDFQTRDVEVVESYRDFAEVFDRDALPRLGGKYISYQLIRNVLAAHALECGFCVLLDARRPDLREAWFAIMQCVRIATLKTQCKVLTWQELSEALPAELQTFLDCKYGIVPPGKCASRFRDAEP